MDDIDIITTSYPITYLTNKIYGDYSTVTSIYPNGVDIDNYEITDKQIKEYAKSDLFIYNGLNSNEKKIATRLLNANKSIKLIDASQGLSISSSYDELWLSPTNLLMEAQNIKDHLEDYITSTVIKNDLNKKYESIKLTISKFDANFKIIAENASYKDVIVANQSLKFLSRYGYNVICVDEKEDKYKSNMLTAKDKLSSKEVNNVFAIEGIVTDSVKDLKATVINVRGMSNLTEQDVKDKTTYETMMNDFIEALRNEAYSQ